jgi:hypothetical protein
LTVEAQRHPALKQNVVVADADQNLTILVK